MNYLTGYDAWSFYVPQGVIVPLADEPPVWVGRGMDAQSAVLTTPLPRAHILSYADDYVESTVKHPMQFVASVLAERAISRQDSRPRTACRGHTCRRCPEELDPSQSDRHPP
jgi:Xaa-Pro dipeptidase